MNDTYYFHKVISETLPGIYDFDKNLLLLEIRFFKRISRSLRKTNFW